MDRTQYKILYLINIFFIAIIIYQSIYNLQHDSHKPGIVIANLIILLIWITLFYVEVFNTTSLDFKVATVPDSIKCFFQEERCEQGDIDAYSLMNGLFFGAIGYLNPDHHITALIASIFIELFLYFIGSGAKFIVGPLINISGYSIGSALRKN